MSLSHDLPHSETPAQQKQALPQRYPSAAVYLQATVYLQPAANDNRLADSDSLIAGHPLDTPILRAALRLFASHGLGSADYAAAQAEQCFWSGDRDGQRWWMGLGRILDRKLIAQNYTAIHG